MGGGGWGGQFGIAGQVEWFHDMIRALQQRAARYEVRGIWAEGKWE